MRYLKMYDNYLKRLAESGGRLSGAWSVNLVCLPYLVAALFVSGLFHASGGGVVGYVLTIAISLCLLVGCFWAGFRFIYHSSRRNRE